MLLFYLAVYLSAFLLFLIQPMLTKGLLPIFGGSYLVWAAAMVFFQSMLLCGYAASHVLQAKWGARRYGRFHLFVILIPFLLFPFRFVWENPALDQNLAMGVFRQLLMVAGVPFLVLSMTSLILQRWLMISPLPERENPYVLYAASNAGSVSALLAYPILIEPMSTLEQQAGFWWAGYLVLTVLHWILFPWRGGTETIEYVDTHERMSWEQRLRWFLLSLATGTMLLGTTNVITFDLAAIPLLWVLPLTLFMLAYVLVFKRVRWCPPWIEKSLNWSVILGGCLVLTMRLRIMLPPAVMLVLYLCILFVCCMNCNVWLWRNTPRSGKGLTTFYVVIALGGLCGSLLVSWVLPRLTHSLLEYPLGILLTLIAIGRARKVETVSGRILPHVVSVGVLGIVLLALPHVIPAGYPESFVFAIVALPLALSLRGAKEHAAIPAVIMLVLMFGAGGLDRFASGGAVVARLRNYYGIYHIYDREGVRYLQHGTTQHGRQYIDPARSATPLAYYHPTTPAARILLAEGGQLADIGMIGLGTGAFTAYGLEGQQWTIFELDPDNLMLAENYFDYLAQARRQGVLLQVVFGDGRMRLAQEPPASYDLIIMDAFNSGAIPVHLLTVEALEEYMQRLRPDGILLLHVSNRMLDLVPVVQANAAKSGFYALTLSNEHHVHPDAEMTVWMAVGRDAARMDGLQQNYGWHDRQIDRLPRPWTDRYSNLPGAIRWF